MENDFKPQEVNQPLVQKGLIPTEKTFYQANKIYVWAIVVGAVMQSAHFRPAEFMQVNLDIKMVFVIERFLFVV